MTAVIVIATVMLVLIVGFGLVMAAHSGSRPRNQDHSPDHQQSGYSGASWWVTGGGEGS